MKSVHACLLGLTHPHSAAHLSTLQSLDLVESVSLCPDEDELLPENMAKAPKVTGVLAGVGELVARTDIPVVFVTLRNSRVRGAALRLIEAGKHLMCEKPVGCCAEDARALSEAAARKKVQACVCFPFRYHPTARAIRNLIQAGALGRILQTELRMVASQVRHRDPSLWLFDKKESGGGILSWLGCHWLDLIRVLLNDEIAAVSGVVATLSGEKISVEDCACISFRFRKNAIGSLTAGYLLPVSAPGYGGSGYDTTIRIWGTEGRIVWDEALTKTRLVLESNASPWRGAGPRETEFDLPRVRAYGGAYGLEFAGDFLRATQGENPPPATLEDAVWVHRIIDAAYRASAEGREVTVA